MVVTYSFTFPCQIHKIYSLFKLLLNKKKWESPITMKQVGSQHRIIPVFSPSGLDPGRAGTILRVAGLGASSCGLAIQAIPSLHASCTQDSARACLCKMSALCKPTAGSVAGYCVNMWGLGVRPDLKDGTQLCNARKFYIFRSVCFKNNQFNQSMSNYV